MEFYTLHFFDATFIPKAFLSLLQMLAALKKSPDSMNMSSLKEFLDPNMMDLYPHDCLFKVKLRSICLVVGTSVANHMIFFLWTDCYVGEAMRR